MKIGIDCHNLEEKRTGTGRYLMNLLKYWAKEFPPEADQPWAGILYFKNQIPKDVPRSENFQNKILKSNSNFWFEHILLPKAIKKDKIDVFFSPSYILPFKIPENIKTAVAIHDISYEAHPEWYSWQNRILLRWISRRSVKKADIIFTCSEFTKKEILKYYSINPEKIHVILLAADEKFILNPTIKKEKLIFYVGAIFNRRFVSQTIEAFKKIKNKIPDYQLLIAGPNYTQPFIDIKSEDSITYVDYVRDEELISLYNSANLFIWLSSYEGFGLPPLEAMACGTPVITTGMGSLPEVVGDAALFVKNPEDVDEISEKMLRVLNDEQLKNMLIKKGLEQAQKFSWQKTAEKTLNKILIYAK